MAKKKNENTLQYLQMPLPSGGKFSKMTKVAFGGLNKRHTLDSGDLTMEKNISTSEYPYLVPSSKNVLCDIYGDKSKIPGPIGLFGFDDILIVVYRQDDAIKLDYIYYVKSRDRYYVRTGVLKESGATFDDELIARCIVQFNKYEESEDVVNGEYVKKLLIFPDKKSMKFRPTTASLVIDDLEEPIQTYTNDVSPFLPPDDADHNCYYKNTNAEAAKSEDTLYGKAIYKWVDGEGWKISIPPTFPDIKYATVHLSRLFGVSDDCVYASGFNDYTNWTLDSADEYNEANAWFSQAQSNTKAGGNFTGITTFDSHIICFKRDFMHEVYNTKNPFRLQDIYAEGCIDNRTIQNVDGKLIFVSEDDVKIYTGSNPRIIGYNLNMPQYEYAVSGTDNRKYYLYCEDASGALGSVYVYDTYTDLWSEQSVDSLVIGFAHNKNGMYMLCYDGYIYKMDTNNFDHNWSFETDLITNKTVDIKHIKKLQMLVEIPDAIGGEPNVDEDGKPANMQVYILYDDESFDNMTDDEKAKRLVYTSTKTGKFPIRVKPRKTANYGFKLHVEGAGYVKLYELEIFIEAGGDLYV